MTTVYLRRTGAYCVTPFSRPHKNFSPSIFLLHFIVRSIHFRFTQQALTHTLAMVNKEEDDAKMEEDARRSNIKVVPTPFDRDNPGNIPQEHRAKFEDIQDLGMIRYREYGNTPRSPSSPPRTRTVRIANAIREKALACKRFNYVEDGWRMFIENKLFDRFDLEVNWYVTPNNFRLGYAWVLIEMQ